MQDTEKAIADFAQFVKDEGRKDAAILTDVEALEADLSDATLWVLGTMKGNLWLKEHADSLPFRIYTDKIVADKEYIGTDLRFVTAWKHFENNNQGVLILTAQKASDIPKNFNLMGKAARSDFVILRGTNIISYGSYNKQGENWVFERKTE